MADWSRRRLLRAGGSSAAALALAGCSALPVGRSCELHHEVWPEGEYGGYGGQRIDYADLSDRGKQVFRKALDGDGHTVPARGDVPPTFSYSDAASAYVVSYEGTNYTLLTYTDEGCTVE